MDSGDSLVDVRGISRGFAGVTAVDDVSMQVRRGDFLTILGPSGCGKTTLLRMIAGFLRPDSGEVRIDGRPMNHVPAHRRSIGMVFQRLALFPHMTAADNVAYPLRMRGFDRGGIPDRVRRYLRLTRLDGLEARRPHELSGGQQQRVAIARALSFGPDLLLLDEPLSALDRKLREEMQLEFRRIQQELGVTTINVTHDQREALVMSDRIMVMEAGRIQQHDAPERVYREPANRFVAGFLGMTSILAGTVEPGASESGDGGTSHSEFGPEFRNVVRVGSVRLRGRSGIRFPPGSRVECAIRAERVQLLTDGDARPDTVLAATIRQRVFEGDRNLYELEVPDLGAARLYAFDPEARTTRRHAPQDRVTIGWNAEDLLLFPVTGEAGNPGGKRQKGES